MFRKTVYKQFINIGYYNQIKAVKTQNMYHTQFINIANRNRPEKLHL